MLGGGWGGDVRSIHSVDRSNERWVAWMPSIVLTAYKDASSPKFDFKGTTLKGHRGKTERVQVGVGSRLIHEC